jgi:hypothetical protein
MDLGLGHMGHIISLTIFIIEILYMGNTRKLINSKLLDDN